MEKKQNDIYKYLSNNEKNKLKKLNKTSNKLNKDIRISNDILNLPIKSIINRWSIEMSNIIIDLTNFFSNLKNNDKNFNDIDNLSQILAEIIKICNKLVLIFLKGERSIYFGLTLIILSFLLYIIQISS
tara:strand:+ start:574 stop:960 length:387 start_codon:yes stop_codon:yes gene_type:complete